MPAGGWRAGIKGKWNILVKPKKGIMKKWSLVILVMVTVVFTACEKVVGEGPIVTQHRSISNFSGIDLRMNADVIFTQSPNYSVEVRAQQNVLDVLGTEKRGNKLVIKLENDVRLRRHEPVTLYVSGPHLSSLRVSGSGNIKTPSLIDADNLEIDISGSGDVQMADLVAPSLEANISGSGNIKVGTGVVPEEKLRISGSGDIDLANVQAQRVNTTTSGSGNIRVHALHELNVIISGSGNVYYKGQPSIYTSTSGSGKVRPM